LIQLLSIIAAVILSAYGLYVGWSMNQLASLVTGALFIGLVTSFVTGTSNDQLAGWFKFASGALLGLWAISTVWQRLAIVGSLGVDIGTSSTGVGALFTAARFSVAIIASFTGLAAFFGVAAVEYLEK
jgi:hypothetical protein